MSFLTKVKELFFRSTEGYACDACGREVFGYPFKRLCESCESKLIKNDGRTCGKCGRAMKAEGICLTCKTAPPEFAKARSPLVYHGDGALLINRLKAGKKYLASYFAEEMSACLPAFSYAEPPLLVPVPVTEEKRKKRGFNQAEELAKKLSELTGYLVENGMLVKVQDGEQKQLDAKSRHEKIRGTIRVKKRKACEGKTILLVDDILTTGATGSECARVLLNAGAKEVCLITACSLPHRE